VRTRLLPLSTVVTPNLEEAAALVGYPVRDSVAMERAGRALLEMGAGAVLIKGGHLAGESLVDVLVTRDEVRHFEHPRIATRSTHGTGCTLSAAITAGLVRRLEGWTPERLVPWDLLTSTVGDALEYVQRAIAGAPGLGRGAGPLNHSV
jgi:hydroxymethylpyrimidine/phosphomethylpyrimidine kinase